jgi:hypothetical protein
MGLRLSSRRQAYAGEHCGEEFVQNKGWQRFCSTGRNNAWNYQQRKREQVERAEKVQALRSSVQQIVKAMEPVRRRI